MLSLTGRRWLTPPPLTQGQALAHTLGLPPLVASVLHSRGISTAEQAQTFLSPQLSHLPHPHTLQGMQQAVHTLAQAITQQQRIAIFGDYDVDGACATAIVGRYLGQLGITPILYIPDRITEGYGPTPEAFTKLAGQGAQVVITVDTGTTAHAAMLTAQQLGLQVVVTDHHQPSGPLPPCAALLNPHREDDVSELRMLCGSGVAFYLLMALNKHLREAGYFTPTRPEPKLTQLLDLVALATVADVMPLTGANRTLVAMGLRQLATWQNRGLAALATVAGVKDDALTTHTLGYQLGPRLNAAGRLESALTALQLLMANEDEVAIPLAHQLNDLNHQRREVEQAVQAQALQQAEVQAAAEAPVLILHGAGWHPGVVGIVAGRIKEVFQRPTFVLGQDENGQLKGSARSVPGINVGDAVHAAHAHLSAGGGHAMAAGVTLQATQLAAFTQAITQHIMHQIASNPQQFPPHLPMQQRLAPPFQLSAQLAAGGANMGLVQTLQQLAPYGPENPEPLLALGPTSITHARAMGAQQQHIRLSLATLPGQPKLTALMFNAFTTPLGAALMQHAGRPVTLLGHLRTNTYQGQTTLDFHISDATFTT